MSWYPFYVTWCALTLVSHSLGAGLTTPCKPVEKPCLVNEKKNHQHLYTVIYDTNLIMLLGVKRG